MQDPAILRQRAKVRLVRDAELEQHLPRREAIVEVTLADGTRLTERVDAVRGTAENPMARAEVVSKCQDLMAPILGADRSASLVERILNLEKVADVRALQPLLQRR